MSQEKGKAGKAVPVASKQALLSAGFKVFAERGFDGATVKDLADAAGVNISMVSYYFNGKEGLYRACLETYGQEGIAFAERLLKAPKSAEEFTLRLRLFAEEFLHSQLEHGDLFKIMYRDFENNNAITKEVFTNYFAKTFQTVVGFYAAAQKAKIIKSDINPEIIAGLLLGALVHMIRMEPAKKLLGKKSLEDPKHFEDVIDNFIKLATEGCLKRT